MKQKLVGSIALSMVAMLFLSMMAILPVHAVTPEVYMVPSVNAFSTATTSLGYKWNITFYVKDVADLFAYQVYLTVDDTMLNITRAWLPTWDPAWVFTGRAEVSKPAPFFYDFNTNGISEAVKIGATIVTGATYPQPGDIQPGKLAIIELKIINVPGKYGVLSSTLGINNIDTKLVDSNVIVIPSTKTDGSFTYTWSPPATNPHLAVSPTYKKFGPDPPSAVGQAFNIEVWLKNLDSAWGLTNATFTLSYNTTVIDVLGFPPANITLNLADWAEIVPTTITHGVPDVISFSVAATHPLGGNILIATITFTVMMQQGTPPYPMTWHDDSPLTFGGIILMDHTAEIPHATSEDGLVEVWAMRTLPIAYLTVDPLNTVLGPDLVVGPQFGQEFEINVNINELDHAWRLVGVQFKITWDPTLMEVVSVKEGPFLPSFPNAEPPADITFFTSFVEPDGPFGPYVQIADLLLPNATGQWNIFPEGTGTIATIRFRAIKQSWVSDLTHTFTIYEQFGVDDSVQIVPLEAYPGFYTVLKIADIGRRIDVWMQYDSPYGGQGLNQTADLVVPQQEILLTAKVTYNWWPVENKKVTFEVRDNQGNVIAVLSDLTDADGHAYASFRMPAEDERLFGVWTVTASVNIAEQVVVDVMKFHFDDLVRIWSVTTDKLEYIHLATVKITVFYGTHAIQLYDVVLYVVIKDNLDVPVGIATVSKTVGGSTFSVYKNYYSTFFITIPHSAYAGSATVHVNVLDKLPSAGGTAVTPEATKVIYILPY